MITLSPLTEVTSSNLLQLIVSRLRTEKLVWIELKLNYTNRNCGNARTFRGGGEGGLNAVCSLFTWTGGSWGIVDIEFLICDDAC